MDVFKTDRIPSLSRLPKEINRAERHCDRCGGRTQHILYLVPRRRALFLYFKNHPENVHATCTECARSVVLKDEEREAALSGRN